VAGESFFKREEGAGACGGGVYGNDYFCRVANASMSWERVWGGLGKMDKAWCASSCSWLILCFEAARPMRAG